LGMKDTGFSVPAPTLDRFTTGYWINYMTGTDEVHDPAAGGQWSSPPAFPSGGGGLVSTVDDYLAFSRMMLNQGRHGGGRILSRPSVETMTIDHLTAEGPIGPDSGLFRRSRLGVRRGRRHPARGCGSTGRQLWLGRRLGHFLAFGPQRGHGHDPVDPGLLDLAGAPAREPRFPNRGLPGDRRLNLTSTWK